MENYENPSFAAIDELAAIGWRRPPASAIVDMWQTASDGYELKDSFGQLRSVEAQKIIFKFIVGERHLGRYLVRLEASRWSITIEELGNAFGYVSLLSTGFTRSLARISRWAAEVAWEVVLTAIRHARDARLDSTNARTTQSGRDWRPEDITAAMKKLGLGRTKTGQKKRPTTVHHESRSPEARRAHHASSVKKTLPSQVPTLNRSRGHSQGPKKRSPLRELLK
ncbi:hypothetical protein P171DRAFT_492020 [Karstenula rhodostoma CBS 690.94]|uniref:Uncharacterized protein n=1 Tax=Karstenula rhodostoma CBS 690.94 TaxID=1392251 RepID=A0A9P4U661_9PLEO|nr:hypothetical protein P171DRAFT_492020 [Karstenula rhodostoma CBS 690.94]